MEVTAAVAAAVLVVKVFSGSQVGSADLRAARSEAEAILADAGVHVVWTECTSEVPGPAACAQPHKTGELLIRIRTAGPELPTHPVAMGTSLIGSGAASAPILATIFADRVNAIARTSGVDNAWLLGRVAAHEIGHLLLNSARHAGSGIMRATWSLAELRRRAAADWAFSTQEAAAMRAAIAARHGTQDPSPLFSVGGQDRSSAARACS